MIVTIDGPAGAGKSSVARRLAARLRFRFLDTGAMYRAVALWLQQNRADVTDLAAVARCLDDLRLSIDGERVIVNGRDVTSEIRTPELSQQASVVAAIPLVREKLVELQREIAENGNYVCEGRDQGTVVFPNAECKFFLTAEPEVRAYRRWLELVNKQPELLLDMVIAEQKIRDLRDETRSTGRLVQAADAILVRVDNLTLDELVDKLEEEVSRRL
jgi:CMP/dCMP kinase